MSHWGGLPSPPTAFLLSAFYFLLSPRGGFARFFCIHHSSFFILHSPQGTLDIPWTCPIPIEPPQTPVFEQPSLSRPLSCGISTAEQFRCGADPWPGPAPAPRLPGSSGWGSVQGTPSCPGRRHLAYQFVVAQSPRRLKPVPVHDNPGENYRDNLGESLPSARVCVTLASISVPVRGQDAAQRHLGGRAGSAAGSGRRGQRMHNLLRFGRLRCDEPRRPDRFKIAREASLLWRTILEQPEVEESLRISRRMWLHAHDLRDFTFGSEQWCHDGA